MNLQQQQQFVDNFCEKMKSTILGKGNDYANADRLSNFKLAGAICGLTAEQNCLSLMATKVARLGVLLGGKTPNNESIEDSLLDLANYAALLGCLREEKLASTFAAIKIHPGNPLGDLISEEYNKPTTYESIDELVRIGKDDR